MITYKSAITEITQRVTNNVQSLEISSFPRFSEYIGGISEEEMMLLIGATGTSKTKLAIRIVLDTIEYVLANPQQDIQVFYFTLELSAVEIWLNIFCNLLHKKTGKEYSVKYFKNKLKHNRLTEEKLEELNLIQHELELIGNKLIISDKHKKPKPIYDTLVSWLTKVGGKEITEDRVNRYQKNNPNKLVLLVVDTINAFQEDDDLKDKYKSIKRWSQHYCKQLLKMYYKCSIINIQQTDKQSSTAQYTFKGEAIEEKFVPKVENLSEYKLSPDDHTNVISIFNPSKYKIESYQGYNSRVMGNNFRYLEVIKSSHSEEGVGVGIWIDNAHLVVEELPKAENRTAVEQFLKAKQVQTLPLTSGGFVDLLSKKAA